MKISEPVLFDTNVLVYNQDQDSEFYSEAASVHEQAFAGELKPIIASQNLLEFSAVMINPRKIIHPLTQKQVAKEIELYSTLELFTIIYPHESTISLFTVLLNKYKLKNPRHIFDLFLVATMLSNEVTHIITANVKDFPFKEITVSAL